MIKIKREFNLKRSRGTFQWVFMNKSECTCGNKTRARVNPISCTTSPLNNKGGVNREDRGGVCLCVGRPPNEQVRKDPADCRRHVGPLAVPLSGGGPRSS